MGTLLVCETGSNSVHLLLLQAEVVLARSLFPLLTSLSDSLAQGRHRVSQGKVRLSLLTSTVGPPQSLTRGQTFRDLRLLNPRSHRTRGKRPPDPTLTPRSDIRPQ